MSLVFWGIIMLYLYSYNRGNLTGGILMFFKDLLRYRSVWLGVALIWIVLFHLPFSVGPFDYIKSFGYGGVDICIFASGIGCFYSLSSESDILSFMKRRLKRIAPTYIVFIGIWLVYQYIFGDFGFQMVIGNILAIQNFTGHGKDFNWYISALFLLYILAPYFKNIVVQASAVRKMAFLLFLFVCSIPFWKAETYIITITRLPIFYIGMIFADMCKKEKQISGRYIIGMIVAFILGVGSLITCFILIPQCLWSYGLYWYPFILITPPLCVAISCIAIVFEKVRITRLIMSFLSLCGKYSFEIYLIHILLISCVHSLIDIFDLSKMSYLVWIAGGGALFVGCFVLRRFVMCLSNLFSKYRKTFKQKL